MLIPGSTAIAITREENATVEWVLSTALRAMLATGGVLAVVSAFTLVAR